MTLRGPYSFSYNTPGLAGGLAFYTPTVGEMLLDLTIRVTTVWNGTAPRGDVGQATSGTTGLYNDTGVNTFGCFMNVLSAANSGGTRIISPGLGEYGSMFLFTTADPLKVWVTQNAVIGAADPGASQGAAEIYFVVATPLALP